MNLKDFIAKFKKDVQTYNSFRAENALIAGLDLIALNRLRIQEEGTDSKGNAFDPYTEGYEEQRIKDGYQTAYVDFTRTGKMMASIQPQIIEETTEGVVIEIRANNDLDQAKINGAFSKRGNILLNTEEELTEVLAAYNERANEKLKTLFG